MFALFLANKLLGSLLFTDCVLEKMLRVPETWLCPFGERTYHASPTPPEDGPPPRWIHLPPGFWILCEDLDQSRNQAQPTKREWEDDVWWFLLESNALEYFLIAVAIHVRLKHAVHSIQLKQFNQTVSSSSVPSQNIPRNLIGYSDPFKGGTRNSLIGSVGSSFTS